MTLWETAKRDVQTLPNLVECAKRSEVMVKAYAKRFNCSVAEASKARRCAINAAYWRGHFRPMLVSEFIDGTRTQDAPNEQVAAHWEQTGESL